MACRPAGRASCYCVLRGLMLQHERKQPGQLVTRLRIALPLPLVFHPWFVADTLVPLLGGTVVLSAARAAALAVTLLPRLVEEVPDRHP